MPLKYNVIEVFTSEEARWQGIPVWNAIVDHVRKSGTAARCMVSRGLAGCYENGEIASNKIEILSFNMPIKVEVILPAAELDAVLPGVEDIVTDGVVVVEDMEVRLHRTQKRLIARQLRVKDAMTAPPQTVSEQTSVSDVIRLLLGNEFNAVPVVDPAGHPVGIISQGDLISRAGMPVRLGLLAQLERHQVEEFLETVSHRTAGEIMTKPVTTVQEDKRLSEAVDVMLKHRLKRLPVVNSQNEIVGVIARSDVFHIITREAPDWKAIRAQNVFVDNVTLVRDIMRRDTHTAHPDTSVEEVVRLIDDSDIQRVAVVDDDGRLLGLISDANLLGLFSEHRAGIWDYLIRKLPFTELARRHRELVEQTRASKAADVMKTDLLTVHEDTRIEDAIKIMAEHSIKRLPVVDENGVFKGMVSRDSVLRAGLKQA
jgi:CBS domain-containing protein